MKTTNELTRLVDELAAHWTDSALEILKDAGIGNLSVDVELELWRALRKVLQGELRWQRAFRFSTRVSLNTLMEQVIRKAVLVVARKLEPKAISRSFENFVLGAVGGRRATAAERRLYSELAQEPAVHAAFKPLSRTDFTPHLRVSAVGS